MAHKKGSLRHRGAAVGRSLARGFRGTAVAGGTGAATFFVHDFAQKNVEFLGKTPWLTPALLLAAGHVVKQRPSMMIPGVAVCGAAGYALGNALAFMFKTKQAAKTAEATKGLEEQETGALLEAGAMPMDGLYDVEPMDTGALVSSVDTLGM